MEVGSDTESDGLSFVTSHIIGFSFSWGPEESYYVPVGHSTNEKQLELEKIRPDLEEFYFNPKRVTAWHNFKHDGHHLSKINLMPRGLVHDTRLMHSLINENGPAGLKYLSTVEIHPDADKWEKAIDLWRAEYARKNKMKKNDVHYGLIPLDMMTPYAGSDAHYEWVLYKKKLKLIMEDPYLMELYLVENMLMRVLLMIEHEGVYINRDYLSKAGPGLDQEAAELKQKIIDQLGKVNVNSNISLIPALQKIGVKLTKTTKTSQRPSLDHEVLSMLATKYQVCEDLLEYRSITKKKSTYVDSILEKLTEQLKLHCEYNQNVTTGRMSSKQPNLQNIPAKDKAIRRAFIPPKALACIGSADHKPCGYLGQALVIPSTCPHCGGHVVSTDDFIMIFADYSQMEVRMTAHYSEDPILLEVYNVTGEDVHTRTMCEMFGYNYDEAVKILEDEKHPDYAELSFMRKVAKMINFLIIYGGQARTLAARISTPKKQYTEKQCQVFIDQYFQKLKGVKKWITNTKLWLRQNGEVQNYFGRYRRFPELRALLRSERVNKWKIERCERQAVNYLIQGSCADLFKIAMVRVNEVLKKAQARSRLVMPIHDEMVFYMHREEISLLSEIVKQMEDFHFKVPMTAEVSYSLTNWAEKKPLKMAA